MSVYYTIQMKTIEFCKNVMNSKIRSQNPLIRAMQLNRIGRFDGDVVNILKKFDDEALLSPTLRVLNQLIKIL